MNKNQLQKIEPFETVVVIILGIIVLLTLEPISTARLTCALLLGALLIVLAVHSLWERRHHHA
jgi:uncharacterized membrane protein YcaP (DUF421 family)